MADPDFGNQGTVSLTDLLTTMQQGVRAMNQLTSAIRETFPNWVDVPATASSTGTAGQVAYASGFLYICVASNTWQRVAIATF